MNMERARTAVAAHFDEQGRPHVLSFTWRGSVIHPAATGRTWVDAAGRHVLVMTGAGAVFELLLDRPNLDWWVVRAPCGFGPLLA
jgi:hypothetical protein